MPKNKRLQMQRSTNDLIMTPAARQLVVMDRYHSSAEVVAMLNQAHTDGAIIGARKSATLNHALFRLLWLCKDIVDIANYASRLDARESLLLMLAQKEAGLADYGVLASEVKKRLDVYNNDLRREASASITELDPEFVAGIMEISQAVQCLKSDDASERAEGWETLQSAEINHFIGDMPQWVVPDDKKKPSGMSDAQKWLAQQALKWRKHYPRGWHNAGKRIVTSILHTPDDARSPEQIETLNILGSYMDESRTCVTDKGKMDKYLSNLVRRFKLNSPNG